MLSIILAFIFALTQLASGNDCSNHGSYGRIIGGHLVPIEDKGKVLDLARVSVQGVESLWDNCRFIPADWGSL